MTDIKKLSERLLVADKNGMEGSNYPKLYVCSAMQADTMDGASIIRAVRNLEDNLTSANETAQRLEGFGHDALQRIAELQRSIVRGGEALTAAQSERNHINNQLTDKHIAWGEMRDERDSYRTKFDKAKERADGNAKGWALASAQHRECEGYLASVQKIAEQAIVDDAGAKEVGQQILHVFSLPGILEKINQEKHNVSISEQLGSLLAEDKDFYTWEELHALGRIESSTTSVTREALLVDDEHGGSFVTGGHHNDEDGHVYARTMVTFHVSDHDCEGVSNNGNSDLPSFEVVPLNVVLWKYLDSDRHHVSTVSDLADGDGGADYIELARQTVSFQIQLPKQSLADRLHEWCVSGESPSLKRMDDLEGLLDQVRSLENKVEK